MNCPNCEVAPEVYHDALLGHMLMCGRCRMWTNWHHIPDRAKEAWNKQAEDVLECGGHLKWRASHPA